MPDVIDADPTPPGAAALPDAPAPSQDATAAAEEHSLWRRWRSQADRDARLRLILHYLWLARTIAHSVFNAVNGAYSEIRDFLQLAATGLIEAVDRFDPDRGASFPAYASSRIRGAVLNGLEKHSEYHAQHEYRRLRLRERTADLAQHAEGERVPDAFMEMIDLALGLAVGCMLEGTALYQGGESSPAAAYGQPGEIAAVGDSFKALVDQLPDVERSVVELHYFHGMQFADIARYLELSRSRISQIHARAIKALRRRFDGRSRLDISA